jgi:hypothetical protein
MTFISFERLVFALELEIMIISFLVKSLFQKFIGATISKVLICNEGNMILVDSTFSILMGHF